MKVFVLYTGYENDVELFETVEGAMTHGKRSIAAAKEGHPEALDQVIESFQRQSRYAP